MKFEPVMLQHWSCLTHTASKGQITVAPWFICSWGCDVETGTHGKWNDADGGFA